MRCQIIILALVSWLVFSCGAVPDENHRPIVPGAGRLCKFSQSTKSSDKKVIFIHGRALNITDPNGPSLNQMESLFSLKTSNLNFLCQQKYGQPLTGLAEIWFYGYYPQQDISKIADDLARAIQANSEFSNSTIALVGYSQGGVISWLVDQRHPGIIAGGVLLGAPIRSTPLAHKSIRDAAVRQIFPVANSGLSAIFDQLTSQSDSLMIDYVESGKANSKLLMFAGILPAHPPTFWQRNIDILDALVAKGGNFFAEMQDDQQIAELGATIINLSNWRDNTETDHQSDGLVPVSSAVWGATESHILAGYDHYDLLSGQGDLSLDQTTFDWLDQILNLAPAPPVFSVGNNVPTLPEISINLARPLVNAKFAYIANQQICLVGADWQNPETITSLGIAEYPRFSNTGTELVWTQTTPTGRDIYLLSGAVAKPITTDGVSRYVDFSPDNKWLVYQSGQDLVIHNLAKNSRATIISGVDLLAPPAWITVDQFWGHIYFVSRDATGKTNLYWVSPRLRNKKLVDAALALSDCQTICLARGTPIGGILATQTAGDKTKLSIVTNALAEPLFVEIQLSAQSGIIPDGNTGLTLQLNQPYQIESLALDLNNWQPQLYLSDQGDHPGIYVLNLSTYINDAKPSFDDCYKLVMPNATQLDMNPAVSP